MKNFIIGLVLIFALFYFLGQATSPKNSSEALKPYQAQVANDFEQQYNTQKSSGTSKVDLCVRAGLVAEGYLQAKDTPNYQKWSATKKAECSAAGVPQY